MKFLRWTMISVGIVAAVLLLGAGAVAWLLGTERGSAWVLSSVLNRAQAVVSVGRIEGTLLDELTFGDIVVVLNGDRIEIEELRLTLDTGQILRRALVIERLHATRATYTRAPGPRPPAGSVPQPLPVAVEIREATVDGLAIVSGQDELVFDPMTFAAVFSANELVIEGLETGSRGVRMTGRGELGVGASTRLSAQIDWLFSTDTEPLAGRLTLSGTLPELDVSHELLSPFDVTAAGKVWLESPPRVDLVLRWRDVSIPGRDEIRSESGSANVVGEISSLRYSSDGAISAYDRDLDYSAEGSIDGAVLVVDSLTVDSPAGTVSASGAIALDSMQWEMAVDGRDLDTSAYDAAWPGRVSLNAGLLGRLQPLQIRIENANVEGVLRDYPFTAIASGTFDAPGRIQIDRLDVSADGDTFNVSGTIDERIDLALVADVTGFERLWPDLSGALVGDVRVVGTIQQPQVSGRIEAREVQFRDNRVARVELRGSLGAYSDGDVELGFVAERARIGGLDTGSLTIGVDGTVANHSIDVDASAEQWNSTIAGRGGFSDRIWRGFVETAVVHQSDLGDWRLLQPARVEAAVDRLVLDSSCLSQQGSDLCATLRIAGRADDEIVLSARNFELQALQPFLPEMLSAFGAYQVAGVIHDPIGDPHGRVALTGGRTRLSVALSETEVVETELEEVTLGVDLDDGRLDLQLDLNGGDVGRVSLRTTVADVRSPDSPLEGRLDLTWQDLNLLTFLSPDLGSVAGSASIQLDLGGTVAEPQLSGRGQWNDGAVVVPSFGTEIDMIEAAAVTVDGNTLEYSGTGFVDGRELHVRGSTLLDPQRNWPTRLDIDGESLPLVQLADAEILVSPELQVEVALPDITVTGTLHVPRAVIALDQLPAQAQRPSADSIVHGVSDVEPVRPLRARADLRVTLGDDVHYNGSNLTSDLHGELRLIYESGRAPTASGSLSITGTYNAYGQELQLERGELRFTGPLDDPVIDVRAERTIGETTAGIQLTGTLKSPITRIYSNPSLGEADALAYLLLGRPLSGTGEEETATLESAALSMGLQQALPVVQRIGDSLGLDELSIEANDIDAGALMAGKYLSPKLYIRYSYGLFNRIGGILVRFRVNERLSIETRSGDEKSMDLLYTVEKE